MTLHKFPAYATMLILLLLAVIFWTGGRLSPAAAQAAPQEQAAPQGQAATPVPGSVEKVIIPAVSNQAAAGNQGSVSPVVGILVLLAPLAFVAWMSRGKKQPKITSVSCLPVIDENGKGGFLNQDQD